MAFTAILTDAGQAKIQDAVTSGGDVTIATMAVGDGGGSTVTPQPSDTALVNSVYSAAVNRVSQDANGNMVFELIIPVDQGGWTLREVGAFDDAGDLFAVAPLPEQYKPTAAEGATSEMVVRMVMSIQDSEVVSITVDASTVTATQQWVRDGFAAHVGTLKALADSAPLQVDGLPVKIGGFFDGAYALADPNEAGGSWAAWDSNRAKADADGAFIIDPGKMDALATTRGASDMEQYAADQGTGTGTGCFVRQVGPSRTPEMCGAIGDDTAIDTVPFRILIEHIKSLWNVAHDMAPVLELSSAAKVYRVTETLMFGPDSQDAPQISRFRGNGSVIHGAHTGIVVDGGGLKDADIDDLRIFGKQAVGETPSIGLAMYRRAAGGAGQGFRNNIKGLRIRGDFTELGLYSYGSESNSYPHYQIDVSLAVAAAVFTDTGAYWDGSAYVKPTLPNLDDANPPGQESNTNNHFYSGRFNHQDTSTVNGHAALQLIGAQEHTFHGMFINVDDNGVRGIFLGADTGNGGDNPNGNVCFGLSPHGHVNQETFIEVQGGITCESFKIHGWVVDKGVSAANQDVLVGAGAVLKDSVLHVGSINIQGEAWGHNDFKVDVSFEAAGRVEGTLALANNATLALNGNAAFKRLTIFDTINGRAYHARDIRDFDSVSTSGTGEQDLKSYTITGSQFFMGAPGRRLFVRAAGTKTGAAGNKRIKFYLGSTSWELFPLTNDELNWAVEAEIYSSGAASQVIFLRYYQNDALVFAQQVTAAEDLSTGTPVMKLTGQCTQSGDVITQTAWIVEYR